MKLFFLFCFSLWAKDPFWNVKKSFEELVRSDMNECEGYETKKHEGKRKLSFVAFGDTQVGSGSSDKNDFQIEAINHLHKLDAPEGFPQGTTEDISGVIMAGDITASGSAGADIYVNESEKFINYYGLCGNKKLNYPIFEGYGNHDFYAYPNPYHFKYFSHPAVDMVSMRNNKRPYVEHKAPGKDGHYSWTWQGIHFIQLNLMASDRQTFRAPDFWPFNKFRKYLNPRKSLSFLKNDLEKVGKKMPTILIFHYGLTKLDNAWWSKSQREEFYKAIKDYNVKALIHGHHHDTSFYNWKGYPVFNVGSPYYKFWNLDFRGHFTLFHIDEENIYASDISWTPNDATNMKFNDRFSVKIPLK